MPEETTWRRYSHLDKTTAPPEQVMVWVWEIFYHGDHPTIGIFDGFCFRVLPSGTDDCHVTHWMPMTQPEPVPAAEVEAWENEVEAAEKAAHPEWFKE